MNIQTISIVVPTKGCVNSCKFCVSRMHCNSYEKSYNSIQIMKRIKWANMNGVNTCIITGTGELFQNTDFLGNLAGIFTSMKNPFPNVEIQTTGVMLDKKYPIDPVEYPNINLLKELGVNTISLSVSNVFDDDRNMEIIGTPEKLRFKLNELITFLKSHNFNIRLSLNMISDYENINPHKLLIRVKELGADQVTFRKMYHNGDDSFEQTKWVKENSCSDFTINKIRDYIEGSGNALYTLPFGGRVYSIMGMSTVMDDDCMSQHNIESLKYVILRENGKLYCRWNDSGSLIF